MVVVEGVARTFDPHINIWKVAQPTVEAYIKDSIGPKALLRDLGRTALVLARFGPRLPQLAQNALIRQNAEQQDVRRGSVTQALAWMVCGGTIVAVAVWIGTLI